MTLKKWGESVRIAKIKMKIDPNSFTLIKGKLLQEAQTIYVMLLSIE
tara:strand:- start:29027 stop:29167 length:141 start_codon:yes stop_codon:yes gene_type:complete